ncbi:MAG: PAS domain-containing protein [Hyphomicrobiales bacterium]
MKHTHTNELYIYWNRIRGARIAPDRSALEPADIRNVLKDTFILHVGGSDDYTFRLAGTRTCSLFGREVKNSNFMDLLDGDSKDAIQTLLHTTCEDASVNILGLVGKNRQGLTIPLEAIFLPLKLNGRTDARIMGCLAPLQMPYWAGMEPIKQLQLSSLRMIMPHQHKVEIARPVQADIEAEEQSMKFAGSRKVGHLTVLDGGVH